MCVCVCIFTEYLFLLLYKAKRIEINLKRTKNKYQNIKASREILKMILIECCLNNDIFIITISYILISLKHI